MDSKNRIVQYLHAKVGEELKESPSAVSQGLKGILKDIETGKASMEYTVRPDMTNLAKTLHGGMASTIIDDVIGIAVFALDNEYFFTSVNLTVDFLSAAPIGEKITCTATVVRKGSRLINAEATIFGSDNRIIAKGTSNLIVTTTKAR
jgi:acyl-coenzyme A thioesterase 13